MTRYKFTDEMHMPDFIYGPFPMKIQISTCVVHVLYSPLYNLNEWKCPWRFLWSQSLFVTGAWVVLFALLILPLYFNLRILQAYDGENLTYACECKLIKLSLRHLLMFSFSFYLPVGIRRIPMTSDWLVSGYPLLYKNGWEANVKFP